uniref:Large ribosomal subunit protein uL23c n=1 Tax=Boodleopsis sp. FL1161 TaxID=2364084 RepID=A0A386AZB2_9CHLO|nr:ribosomal protein L23 [Boodleopsis sp. FL1161]
MKNNINKLLDFLKKPIFTEKMLTTNSLKNYTFDVDSQLTKIQIKKIFENSYGTKVQSVKTNRIKTLSPSKKRIKINFTEAVSLIDYELV